MNAKSKEAEDTNDGDILDVSRAFNVALRTRYSLHDPCGLENKADAVQMQDCLNKEERAVKTPPHFEVIEGYILAFGNLDCDYHV